MSPALPAARVRVLLDAYGADPARWPEAERDAALAALAADPALAAARDAAARLDAALAELPPAPVPAINPLAVTAAAAAKRSRAVAGTPARPLWPRAAGLAAAALVGFVVGWSGVGGPERDDRLAFLAGIEEDVL